MSNKFSFEVDGVTINVTLSENPEEFLDFEGKLVFQDGDHEISGAFIVKKGASYPGIYWGEEEEGPVNVDGMKVQSELMKNLINQQTADSDISELVGTDSSSNGGGGGFPWKWLIGGGAIILWLLFGG